MFVKQESGMWVRSFLNVTPSVINTSTIIHIIIFYLLVREKTYIRNFYSLSMVMLQEYHEQILVQF